MNDSDERLVKHLTEAVCANTEAVRAHTCAVTANLVTRCDLNAMEARLQAGWTPSTEDQKILETLLARSGRVARKLEALDAKTPAQ